MDTDRTLVDDFTTKHPFSAAQVLDGLKAEVAAEFIQQLPIGKSLQLLDLMSIDKAADCFSLFPMKLAKELMESSDISFAESLCRQFDEAFRVDLLASLSPGLSSAIARKLEQTANTVGVFMVPVPVLNKEMNVQNALEMIKRNKDSLGSYLYVVDVQGTFEGAIRLEELLFAERNATLGGLMITTMPRFFPDTPIKNVQDDPAWYEYRFIPVIDRSGRLLGNLPFQAIREADPKKSGQLTKDILETGTALSELYLIGLTGFLQSVGK